MKYIHLLIIIFAALLLASCKPKPVSGQIFSSSNLGTIPLGGADVSVVNNQDVEGFISNRNEELQTQFNSLKSAFLSAKENESLASKKYGQAQFDYSQFMEKKYYATNAAYISALKNKKELSATNDSLFKIVNYLKSQSQSIPTVYTANGQAQAARTQMEKNEQWISFYTDREIKVEDEIIKTQDVIDEFESGRNSQAYNLQNQASRDLEASNSKLQQAAQQLKDFVLGVDFFQTMNIAKSSEIQSGIQGDFLIQPTAKNQKIFATWKESVTGKNCYWVESLPTGNSKLILTPNNVFIPPFLSDSNLLIELGLQSP